MNQPYGQQPGGNNPGSGGFQQPGGNYPGSGGFQQPGGGGFPQAPQAPGYEQGGYPQQGGYGAMPQAPQEYGGPVARPGGTTAAAVLAFVQAGITLITTGILAIALAAIADLANDQAVTDAGGVDISASLTEAWIITVVQLIGVGLLIFGGVKLMSGTAGPLFLIAVGLQIALCIYWLVREAAPVVPVALIVMPIVALFLSLSSANKDYVRSRTGRA